MATIKKANTNEITEKVVESMTARDEQRKKEIEDFHRETDDVIRVAENGKRNHRYPGLMNNDTMCNIVASVPGSVAVEAVNVLTGKNKKFKDEYPCLTSFAMGLMCGMLVAVVATVIGFFA